MTQLISRVCDDCGKQCETYVLPHITIGAISPGGFKSVEKMTDLPVSACCHAGYQIWSTIGKKEKVIGSVSEGYA